MFAACGLLKVHRPINLQVNPDRSTAIAWRKRPGVAIATKGFFLVQGIAVERAGLYAGWELEFRLPITAAD